MVILLGLSLLELILVDFLRENGRRKGLICVQRWKGWGFDHKGEKRMDIGGNCYLQFKDEETRLGELR